jgi:hypothetical protein
MRRKLSAIMDEQIREAFEGFSMKFRCNFCLFGLLFLCPSTMFGADLTRIDRTIAKEPAYKTKPKYCLLVFGSEATHRAWLVLDGDTLYVDRNGNGDLTEPGENIVAATDVGTELTFKAPDIQVGGRVHKNLVVWIPKIDYLANRDSRVKALVAKNPDARGYMIVLEVEMPGRQGTGHGGRVKQAVAPFDAHGVLQFADQAKDAPILHFDGPLQITLFGEHQLKLGRETDLVLGVGSRGLGAGTDTWIDYEGVIPDKSYPIVEITYPGRKPGEPPIREKYELKERC